MASPVLAKNYHAHHWRTDVILSRWIMLPGLRNYNVPTYSPGKVFWLRAAMLGATIFIVSPCSSEATVFDPKPWLNDLDQAREAVATRYANLEWLVLEREVDLSALFADTRHRVESAANAGEARAAFDRLARRFGDGHVQFRWPADKAPTQSVGADCAALGYNERMQGLPTAALMPGYSPVDTSGNVFPAGLIHRGHHTIGVLKIGVFTPQGYPALCASAKTALQIGADRIEQWATNRMTSDLLTQLRKLQAAGADVLLIDLIDNGGGSEWAEAVARMVTGVQLKSARIAFVRGSHWVSAFEKQESELRRAAQSAAAEDKSWLLALADAVQHRRQEAATPCSSSPLWQGQRLSCSWLGTGFYATGLLDSSEEIERLRAKPWARLVFTPLQYEYQAAVWRGPVIVLVNGGTGSAAEEFTAELQDNRAAIVIGAPTSGAGCGHTDGGTPTTLKNSGAVLELPDCVRLRKDGSNEVMGIQPDVLIGLRNEDGPHRRAARISQKLSESVNRALKPPSAGAEGFPAAE